MKKVVKPAVTRGATAPANAKLAGVFANWRFLLVVALFLGGSSTLAWRLVDLQVVNTDFLQAQGDLRTVRNEVVTAHRGMIVDRNGEPLAVSSPVETLWANPQEVDLQDSRMGQLARLLEVSEADLLDQFRHNDGREFMYLRRQIRPSLAEAVTKLGIAGIYSRQEYKRFYPAGEVAAHIIGFTDIDEKGREGMELIYDKWLSGENGKKVVIKDRRGFVVKDLNLVADAKPGNDLQLSIDLRLQYIAYRELKAAVQAHHALAGSLVMLDAKTGEVLAMVNQPSYNPNNREKLAPAALRNRAVTDVMEPGSTVKAITMSAALESGRYTPTTPVDSRPGWLRLNGRTIRDVHDYGLLDLTGVITKSSNIGTSRVALDLTGNVVWDMFRRFGVGQSTGIQFPGEAIGSLPHHERWRDIETATMSYGYGISMTPLQLARAYAVLANDGKRTSVSLIKGGYQEAPQQVLAPNIARNIREMLRTVVEKGGTGTRAAIPFFPVGGKTGTVHKVGPQGYEEDKYLSIFAGIAPIDKPKVVMVVIIDQPEGNAYYGGEVAAPVFGRVMTSAMRLLNVPPAPISTMADRDADGKPLAGRG